ncbi:MAG TPA: hypothetical protein VI728_03880 [Syntrophales bacterium]|nr:hypothetical protein [Syntrophales bacterium]
MQDNFRQNAPFVLYEFSSSLQKNQNSPLKREFRLHSPASPSTGLQHNLFSCPYHPADKGSLSNIDAGSRLHLAGIGFNYLKNRWNSTDILLNEDK